jgi:hypothetical protein
MDGTWKGVDKPGGAHYYTPPSSENPINDCPGCKYGTLEATPDKTIKCIDCDREYTPEELHNLGLIPQERRVELERWVNETEQSWLDRVLREEVSEVKAKKKHNKPSQKARVAGTDYQCAWCPEKILNVDAYISRFRRRPDGQWQHDRLHAECDTASQEWFGEYPFDEFTPHMFRRGTCTEAI